MTNDFLIEKDKKHIVFLITRSDTIGGAQIHVLNLCTWLVNHNYRVSVLHGGKGIFYEILNLHFLI